MSLTGQWGGMQNVPAAVRRGRKLKCPHCNQNGATLGCFHRSCRKSFHLQCARDCHCLIQVTRDLGLIIFSSPTPRLR